MFSDTVHDVNTDRSTFCWAIWFPNLCGPRSPVYLAIQPKSLVREELQDFRGPELVKLSDGQESQKRYNSTFIVEQLDRGHSLFVVGQRALKGLWEPEDKGSVVWWPKIKLFEQNSKHFVSWTPDIVTLLMSSVCCSIWRPHQQEQGDWNESSQIQRCSCCSGLKATKTWQEWVQFLSVLRWANRRQHLWTWRWTFTFSSYSFWWKILNCDHGGPLLSAGVTF